jgi:hypothetical protein
VITVKLSPQARYNRWARQHPEVRAKEAERQRERRSRPDVKARLAAYYREYRQKRKGELKVDKYTVWITQANGRGTCHISSHEATGVEDAAAQALNETQDDWGDYPLEQLRVLGIAKGEIEIIEWNDFDE